MQRTGKLILKIAVLLLVLFVLPSALYGKDPIAERSQDMSRKSWKAILRSKHRRPRRRRAWSRPICPICWGTKSTNRCRSGSRIFYGGHVSCDGCRRNRGSAGDLPERKNAGKAFSEDEEDEVLFLHQGNDERENLPWRREKKEGYLSPNMRIRRQYKKRSKSRKIPADRSRNPGGAGREKRAFRRRHETAARRL